MPWLVIGAVGLLLGVFARPRTKAPTGAPSAPVTTSIVGNIVAPLLTVFGGIAPTNAPITSPPPATNPLPVSPYPSWSFLPTVFTNRATGPVIGPASPILSSAPSGTSKDIGTAREGIGYAGKAASAASTIGVINVPGLGSILGAITGALGLAQAATMDPKTGLASQQQESLQLSSGVSLVTAAATAAALAVSVAASALTGLLLLPITVFFSASSINDANSAKIRAMKEIRDYKQAVKFMKDFGAFVVSMSDRLDELHLLPRASVASRIKWCKDNYYNSIDALNKSVVLVWAWSHIENGEQMVGIQGRDVSVLKGMVTKGTQDAFLVMLFCQDYLARMGQPLPTPPGTPLIQATKNVQPIGLNPAYLPLTGFWAETCGASPKDNYPGMVPGAHVSAHGPENDQLSLSDVQAAAPNATVGLIGQTQYQLAKDAGASDADALQVAAMAQQTAYEAFTSGGM